MINKPKRKTFDELEMQTPMKKIVNATWNECYEAWEKYFEWYRRNHVPELERRNSPRYTLVGDPIYVELTECDEEEEEDIVCIQCGYEVSLNYPDYDIDEPCPLCRHKL